jgi:hypothetical protein
MSQRPKAKESPLKDKKPFWRRWGSQTNTPASKDASAQRGSSPAEVPAGDEITHSTTISGNVSYLTSTSLPLSAPDQLNDASVRFLDPPR